MGAGGVHKMQSGERQTVLCSAETARLPLEVQVNGFKTQPRLDARSQRGRPNVPSTPGSNSPVNASLYFLAEPVHTLPAWVAERCRPFVITLRKQGFLRRFAAADVAFSVRQFQPMHIKFASHLLSWLKAAYESSKVCLARNLAQFIR